MTTWRLTLLSTVAVLAAGAGCSGLRPAHVQDEVAVCRDTTAQVLYFPEDSTYIIVYNSPPHYYPQTSRDLLGMVREGVIGPRQLGGETSDGARIRRPRLREYGSTDCLPGMDEDRRVVEVMLAEERREAGRVTYELGVLFDYGTDLAVYRIQRLPGGRLQVEMEGWIL